MHSLALPTEILTLPKEWIREYRVFIAGALHAGMSDLEAVNNGIEHVRQRMRDKAPPAIQSLSDEWVANYFWNHTAHGDAAEKITLQAHGDWVRGKCAAK